MMKSQGSDTGESKMIEIDKIVKRNERVKNDL